MSVIRQLSLTNYKNLSAEFDFNDSWNFVVAKNGSGKTNLIEAIAYLARGKSFRKIADEHVYPISFQGSLPEEYVLLRGDVLQIASSEQTYQIGNQSSTATTLQIYWRQQKKTFYQGSEPISSRKLQSMFHVHIHAPQSIDLVTGSPVVRRDFLDDTIASQLRGYRGILLNYGKVLRSKNALLKESKGLNSDLASQMQFWNQKLASYSVQIAKARWELLINIVPLLNELAKSTFHMPFKVVGVNCRSKYLIENHLDSEEFLEQQNLDNLISKYEKNIHKEFAAGYSLYGAHRDEYEFSIDGQNIKNFGSRGQQRLMSLFIYLATTIYLETKLDSSKLPVLLLDDIFSELDQVHQRNTYRLLDEKFSKWQKILTSPNRSEIPVDTTFLKSKLITLPMKNSKNMV